MNKTLFEAIKATESAVFAAKSETDKGFARIVSDCNRTMLDAAKDGTLMDIIEDPTLSEAVGKDDEEVIAAYVAPLCKAIGDFFAHLGADCKMQVNYYGTCVDVSTDDVTND